MKKGIISFLIFLLIETLNIFISFKLYLSQGASCKVFGGCSNKSFLEFVFSEFPKMLIGSEITLFIFILSILIPIIYYFYLHKKFFRN